MLYTTLRLLYVGSWMRMMNLYCQLLYYTFFFAYPIGLRAEYKYRTSSTQVVNISFVPCITTRSTA